MPDNTTTQREDQSAQQAHAIPTGRAMHIIYACAIAAVVVGMYFGIRYQPANTPSALPTNAQHTALSHDAGVQPATAYWDIHRGNLGPNAHWHTALPTPTSLDALWQNVGESSFQEKQRDLAQRATRRAYNGAPPTIPHRIDPVDTTSCVACHGSSGMRIGEVVARPMPHIAYANCTQCHVPQNPVTPEELPWLENSFDGLPAPTQGERAWEGAPPTIPHTTAMRSNCMSCHGPNGASGLQSSHPWRTSCTQCHGPSARLNRQPGAVDFGGYFLPYNLPTDDDE